MARRKRLSLETKSMGGVEPPAPAAPPPPRFAPNLPPAASRSAPIAQVAGDSAAQAALEHLTRELEAARASGRLILSLPLSAVEANHLTRDRMQIAHEDMEDLIASLRARGQQVPIEVTALPGGRYGLISGWRRLSALRYLNAQSEGTQFGTILALTREPQSLAETYRAMVEENEIRAGISYYERARIAALVAEAGVYPDARAAIAGLFAAASKAKRSKIGSFLSLYEGLGPHLRFGPAISERLGLALARALDQTPGFARKLADRLRKAEAQSAAEELALLDKALNAGAETTPPAPQASAAPGAPPSEAPPPTRKPPARIEVRPGVWLETSGGFTRATLTLSGPKVDGPLRDRLIDWLQGKG